MPQKGLFNGNINIEKVSECIRYFFVGLGSSMCRCWESIIAWLKATWQRLARPKEGKPAERPPEAVDVKGILGKVWNGFTWAVVAAAVLLAVLFVGVRLFGLMPYCVLSGSMEPKYMTGSLIYVKDADPSEVEVGDTITFVLNEDLVVATHEVYDIDCENGMFFTQGIANINSNGEIQHDASPVLYENLIGKPVFTVPYLGYVSSYLSAPPGMYIGISVAAALFILMFLPDLFKAMNEEEKSDKKQVAPPAEEERYSREPSYYDDAEDGYSGDYEDDYDGEYDESDEYEDYDEYDIEDDSITLGGEE